MMASPIAVAGHMAGSWATRSPRLRKDLEKTIVERTCGWLPVHHLTTINVDSLARYLCGSG